MYFAQYYTRTVGGEKLIPACGDRAVFVLDGRTCRSTQIRDALVWGRKHRWEAFDICKGDSFSRAQKVSGTYRTASH